MGEVGCGGLWLWGNDAVCGCGVRCWMRCGVV